MQNQVWHGLKSENPVEDRLLGWPKSVSLDKCSVFGFYYYYFACPGIALHAGEATSR
jgi:hypothetical protein